MSMVVMLKMLLRTRYSFYSSIGIGSPNRFRAIPSATFSFSGSRLHPSPWTKTVRLFRLLLAFQIITSIDTAILLVRSLVALDFPLFIFYFEYS